MRVSIWRLAVWGGVLIGTAAAGPADAQLGCCELNSPLGQVCASTTALECQPPSTFYPLFECDAEAGTCFEDNNPKVRAFDRESIKTGFELFDGDVVIRVTPGTTVYRRIGVCNETGQTLNYHTVYVDEGPNPEFMNVFFALSNGGCTATQQLETVAETSQIEISKWCASAQPIEAQRCTPPQLSDHATGGSGGGMAQVFSKTAVSVLVVLGVGAPALGLPALGALALVLGGVGIWRARRR